MTYSTHIVLPSGESTFHRGGMLSPYAAEVIAEDALRAGPGARLEITVGTSDRRTLAAVRRRFCGLRDRGIALVISGRRTPRAA
jgi:hypothetical protein